MRTACISDHSIPDLPPQFISITSVEHSTLWQVRAIPDTPVNPLLNCIKARRLHRQFSIPFLLSSPLSSLPSSAPSRTPRCHGLLHHHCLRCWMLSYADYDKVSLSALLSTMTLTYPPPDIRMFWCFPRWLTWVFWMNRYVSILFSISRLLMHAVPVTRNEVYPKLEVSIRLSSENTRVLTVVSSQAVSSMMSGPSPPPSR